MTTIYDIAKLSNTSVATVSYVLNGKGKERRISQKTQDLVLEVANRLNYRPDLLAKNLRTQSYKGIRICLYWPEFYFEQSMVATMRAIREVTRWSVEQVEVGVQYYRLGHFREKWESCSWQMYNGILICGLSKEDMAFVEELKFSLPVVLINRKIEGIPSVSIDLAGSGRMAAEYIHKTGIDSVAAIWLRRYHQASGARQSAFVQRCAELGLDLENSQFFCESDAEDAYNLCLRMIKNGEVKKLFFCGTEDIAHGVSTALTENGYTVGKDVYLFCFNNGTASYQRYFTPSLASVDLKSQQIYEEALKSCVALITRGEEAVTDCIIQPEIVPGASLPEELFTR